MHQPRYSAEYDSRLALYRWQVGSGERLLPPPRRASRVVALGGGTGLPILLQGLKAALFPAGWAWVPARDRDRLTAIVTVADDGGSSGRLRKTYQVLPPGDIRNCLVALADGDSPMTAIFDFRFHSEGEVGGHSLGNLILTALSKLENDFSEAVNRGSEILGVRGRVFPSTTEDVTLRAEFADGSWVEGESKIATLRRSIVRVTLQPKGAQALSQAVDAIAAADVIVIGPGSLYTSLIPNLLVRDLAEAITQSRAHVVLVMNLMTEPGESDGYTATDHFMAIRRHASRLPIHHVLLNTATIAEALLARYAALGAIPVPPDTQLLRAMDCLPVERDLLGVGPKIRHDPHKLAQAVLELSTKAEG